MRNLGVLLFGLLGLMTSSHATLNDLGNGLVNDDTLNITWMKNASLVKTSCDANNALWQAFDPSALPAADQSGRSKTYICQTDNGTLNWFESKAWIVVLNAQNYLGYNDWRLPVTSQPNSTCSNQEPASGGFPAQGWGYNCMDIGSELNHLFYSTLGNGNHLNDNCGNPPNAPKHCFQETDPFINALPMGSWSGTEYAPNIAEAWVFHTMWGTQFYGGKDGEYNVWPVRSGLSVIAPVTPEQVPTLSIWGLGF